jgi:hypothetical protein
MDEFTPEQWATGMLVALLRERGLDPDVVHRPAFAGLVTDVVQRSREAIGEAGPSAGAS